MITFILLIAMVIALLMAAVVFALPVLDIAVCVLIIYSIYKFVKLCQKTSGKRDSR